MSYIKKIENAYNDGKISLSEITELREAYNKKDANEKSKLDKYYESNEEIPQVSSKKNQVELSNNIFGINSYYLWLISCCIFGLIFFMQRGVTGNFSDSVILDFSLSFLSTGLIPMILVSLICLPIKLFSKVNLGKLLFWTSVIFGILNVLNGTFS